MSTLSQRIDCTFCKNRGLKQKHTIMTSLLTMGTIKSSTLQTFRKRKLMARGTITTRIQATCSAMNIARVAYKTHLRGNLISFIKIHFWVMIDFVTSLNPTFVIILSSSNNLITAFTIKQCTDIFHGNLCYFLHHVVHLT